MERLVTVEQLYQAKAERRKRLAALSIDERAKIIDRLHQLCVTMREVRARNAARQSRAEGGT